MSHATGPGALTTDGCAVDLYAVLPAFGEPELIHGALAPGASVLDLGCGVGRIADPLVELGHPVVAVDDSGEMLDRVRRARTVHSRIEEVRLDERFDAVLMASHLVNEPDDGARDAVFATARRQVVPGGTVFVQWHTPEWFDRQRPGVGAPYQLGPVTSVLDVHSVDGDLLTATVSYRHAGREWTQRFRTRRFDVDGLRGEFARHGLVLDRFLTEDRSWVCARPEAS